MSNEASPRDRRYNFERIRTFLIKGFSDSELRDLCFDVPDFEPVYHQLAQTTGKADIVRLLLEYSRQRLLVEQLLSLSKQHNPSRYTAHEPYYLADVGESPYRGLQYFDVDNAGLFFGREALTAKLAAHLIPTSPYHVDGKDRFLAVIGASGSGKSSLVRAGLIPTLNSGQVPEDAYLSPNGSSRWVWYIITPTEHPLKKLATTLISDLSEVKAATALVDALAADPRSLDTAVHQILGRISAKHLLLIVDQFEELFTVCKDEAERRAFVDNLMTTVTPGTTGSTTVVITLRADFYHHCSQYVTLREAVARCQEYIGPMTPNELRQAIEEPAKQAGCDFEPGLVDLLLDEVGDEPGALPLLSHALLETWQRHRQRILTFEGYHESGGIRGAIAQTAETVYSQLAPEQQVIVRRIFLAVTELGEGTQDTRRRAGLTELVLRVEQKPSIETLIETLADARLITTGENMVEVAHEALIREWPTLRRWLDENRAALRLHRRLTETAAEWERNERDSGYLYKGVRLIRVEEWAKTHWDEMNELEGVFLVASRAAVNAEEDEREAARQRELEQAQALAASESQRAEEQRWQLKRLRWLIVGLFVFLLLTISIALFARWQQQRAEQESGKANAARITAEAERYRAGTAEAQAELERDQAQIQRAEAQRQNRLAISRELAAASLKNLDVDPELSVLLAMQAVTVTYGMDKFVTIETQTALHQAVQASRVQLTLKEHGEPVYRTAFSSDGTYLATASEDGTARLWDAVSGQLVHIFIHPGPVFGLAFSPDGTLLATGSVKGTIKTWDIASKQEKLNLIGHAGPVLNVAFDADGTHLATVSSDGTAKIWDAVYGKEILSLPSHKAGIYDVAFSPNGTRLATASVDKTVKVWNVSSGKLIYTLRHPDQVYGVAFSPNGIRLATVGADETTRVWNAKSGQLLSILRGHTNTIFDVTFNSDGTRLATVSFDRKAKVWDAVSGRELITLAGHTNSIYGVAFNSDGTRLATSSGDGTVKVWNVAINHKDEIARVVFSPDGAYLATASFDKTAKIWDALSGELLHIFTYTKRVRDVAFNQDGTRLATVSEDKTLRVWDTASGREAFPPMINTQPLYSVAFSPDGLRLAIGDSKGTVGIWDIHSGKMVYTHTAHTERIFDITFTPDGTHFVTASADKNVKVWSTVHGQTVFTLPLQSWVYSAPFNPDGSLLATAEDNGTVRIWNTISWQLVHTLTGHTARVLNVAFNPSGTCPIANHQNALCLATASSDGRVILWNATSGEKLLTLSVETRSVESVNFSPNGRHLVTAGQDGTIRLYLLDIVELMTQAKKQLTRSWRPEECLEYLHQTECPVLP